MTGRASGAAGPPSAEPAGGVPDLARALAVADAVLYEGYALYPYRSSSAKNRVRWQFGVLAPRAWAEAQGPTVDGVAGSEESWWQQTECLLEAPADAVVHVRLRFLQLQTKTVERRDADGAWVPVDRLDVGDRSHTPFEEAVPQEALVTAPLADLLAGGVSVSVEATAGRGVDALRDGGGREVGREVRERDRVEARALVAAEPAAAPFPLLRLRVRVENTGRTTGPELDRPAALRRALLSAHALIAVDTGSFLSLLDPPEWAAGAARGCRNVRTFPVLAGEPGSTDLVLSAPVILYDHPQVAPESAGDLHDATEIDEILSLRTLTLTEAEKREARGTDPRTAAIVDRVDAMPPEAVARLHGAVRSLRPATPPGRGPGDQVVVDGVPVARGSRVRLRPRRRGTDAHDMFLAGRTARVEAVLQDVEGRRHVAVTVEDDPTAELHQWYGRFHYYSPEEVVPLDAPPGTGRRP